MIADRYLERRFKEGWQEGFKLGWEQGIRLGREESRKHIREVLEQAGIELPPEVRERLFGNPDQDARK